MPGVLGDERPRRMPRICVRLILHRKWGFPVTAKRQVRTPGSANETMNLRSAVVLGGSCPAGWRLLGGHVSSVVFTGLKGPFLRRSMAELSAKPVCVSRVKPDWLGIVPEAKKHQDFSSGGLAPLWDWNYSGNLGPSTKRVTGTASLPTDLGGIWWSPCVLLSSTHLCVKPGTPATSLAGPPAGA